MANRQIQENRGEKDGRPRGEILAVSGEFWWPPLGRFSWPPSQHSSDDQLKERYPPAFYAHGVATIVKPEHNPPRAAAVGESAIYLDVETISSLAAQLEVSYEAVLAQVVSHELAHVMRGDHRGGSDTAVHGWLAEGDAQRDAWQTLTSLLGVSQWVNLAREARAAQVRMAQHQPGAYKHFDASPLEQSTLLGDFRLPERRLWLARTPRFLSEVMLESETEVPVKGFDLPSPGDLMYLGEVFTVVGPWTVIAVVCEPRVGHPSDVRAVARPAKSKGSRTPETVRWLQLRRLEGARVGEDPEVAVPGDQEPKVMAMEGSKRLRSLLREEIEVTVRAIEAEEEALITQQNPERA